MDSMGGMLINGLGASACNSLIYGPFRLKCYVSVPPTPVSVAPGGGVSIREGSRVAEIVRQQHTRIDRQNRVDADEEIDKRNEKLNSQRLITIVVGFNKKTVQREYVVEKERADRIVSIVKLINKTTSTMSMVVTSFKRKLTDIKIKFLKR